MLSVAWLLPTSLILSYIMPLHCFFWSRKSLLPSTWRVLSHLRALAPGFPSVCRNLLLILLIQLIFICKISIQVFPLQGTFPWPPLLADLLYFLIESIPFLYSFHVFSNGPIGHFHVWSTGVAVFVEGSIPSAYNSAGYIVGNL